MTSDNAPRPHVSGAGTTSGEQDTVNHGDEPEPARPRPDLPPPVGPAHTAPIPSPDGGHTAPIPSLPPPPPQQQYWGPPPGPMPAMYQQPMHQQSVVAKNPALAVLASFFIPGLGTLINGQAGKAIFIFLGEGPRPTAHTIARARALVDTVERVLVAGAVTGLRNR